MADEEDVRRIALSLPGVTQKDGDSSFRVADKLFVWHYHERIHLKKPRVRRPDVIAIRVADEWDKQALLAVDGDRFFTTDHYNGYPAVLVRLPLLEADELQELIVSAWRARAPRSLLQRLDETT
jgi:hypothetical protein